MNPRRVILGCLGALMVISAMVTYFVVGLTEDNAFLLGVCSKVGLVLLTIFVAWPSLDGMIERAPVLVNGMMLAALIFIAIRPRLFPLIIAFLIITLVVHFGFRFASTRMQGRRK